MSKATTPMPILLRTLRTVLNDMEMRGVMRRQRVLAATSYHVRVWRPFDFRLIGASRKAKTGPIWTRDLAMSHVNTTSRDAYRCVAENL